jgi:hypothetical protein
MRAPCAWSGSEFGPDPISIGIRPLRLGRLRGDLGQALLLLGRQRNAILRVQEARHLERITATIDRSRTCSSGITRIGPCFKCKGRGKRTFKTAPEQRAKLSGP